MKADHVKAPDLDAAGASPALDPDLEEQLTDLHDRIHKGSYRAHPARRIYIPKADGSRRPLIAMGY